jgi:peptide/nickel transport system substrate-binding protein
MLYRRRKPSEEAGMKGVRLWTAAATAVAAGCAVAPAWAAEGGTLRVNISNSDVQSLDPAIDYEIYGWTVEFATCAKLLNYPDKPGAAGSQLLPEVAAGFPSVSADGRTYTFHLRNTFRFSDGSQVTAASFSRAIERGLSKKMSSAAASFVGDIVGADAVTAGKATRPSGVTANGDTLVVKLKRAAPDFLARIAMNFFCAVPANLPIDPNGVKAPPMAGPYYVASREPGRSIVMKRNPYYKGNRPHHLAEIHITVSTNQAQRLLQVRQGEADIDLSGLPPSAHADNDVNNARFDDPTFNERMDNAANLSGAARYAAYGKLDVDLMRIAAPWASVYNRNVREFVSTRVGCYLYQPVFAGMDLAAACLR